MAASAVLALTPSEHLEGRLHKRHAVVVTARDLPEAPPAEDQVVRVDGLRLKGARHRLGADVVDVRAAAVRAT